MTLPDTLDGWQRLADESADALFGTTLRDEKALGAAVAALSRVYTRERTHMHKARQRQALEARLRFFFLRDLCKVEAPLEELVEAGGLPKGGVWRVLDLGAGLGTTSAGIARVAARYGATIRAVAVDADVAALRSASEIARRACFQLDDEAGDIRFYDVEGRFDLIVFGLVLNELSPEDRIVAIRRFRTYLTKGGSILVLEPALKSITRELHELRSQCLEEGFNVFAPCLHEERCPMLDSPRDWCHESRAFRFPDAGIRVAKYAGLRFERITYAYLTLRHDSLRLRERLPEGGRVVSELLITKGKRELFLCEHTGGCVRIGRLDRHRPKEPDAFDGVRRGDLLRIRGGEPKGGGIRLVPSTEVDVFGVGL